MNKNCKSCEYREYVPIIEEGYDLIGHELACDKGHVYDEDKEDQDCVDYELVELYCCECNASITKNSYNFGNGGNYLSIGDNHLVSEWIYKNINPNERLNVYCSDACLLEALSVMSLNVEEDGY